MNEQATMSREDLIANGYIPHAEHANVLVKEIDTRKEGVAFAVIVCDMENCITSMQVGYAGINQEHCEALAKLLLATINMHKEKL